MLISYLCKTGSTIGRSGEDQGTSVRLPLHPSNSSARPNTSVDQESNSPATRLDQSACDIQFQQRQKDRTSPPPCLPKEDESEAAPGADTECNAKLPAAHRGGAPAVLGKRKLPTSFSGQQAGQPAALSTLRPLCLPKVTLTTRRTSSNIVMNPVVLASLRAQALWPETL